MLESARSKDLDCWKVWSWTCLHVIGFISNVEQFCRLHGMCKLNKIDLSLVFLFLEDYKRAARKDHGIGEYARPKRLMTQRVSGLMAR